jgi:D-glycero-D-manno-heptose 1,7-bisphosphate phosphatase
LIAIIGLLIVFALAHVGFPVALVIFDQNRTLIRPCRRWGILSRGPRTPEEIRFYPRVVHVVKQLRESGHVIAIATNQSDVAKGEITIEQAVNLVESCAHKLGGVAAYRLSAFDPGAPKAIHGQPNPYAHDDPTRKPHPGMILDLMTSLGFDADQTAMVGNSRNDRKAAKAAGVRFFGARRFFRSGGSVL